MNEFYAHLDVCQQCANNPFTLCPRGASLLIAGVENQSPQEPTVSVSQEAKDAGVPVRPCVASFECWPIATAPKDRVVMLRTEGHWLCGDWNAEQSAWSVRRYGYQEPTHWAEISSMVPTEQTAEVSLTCTPPVGPGEADAMSMFEDWLYGDDVERLPREQLDHVALIQYDFALEAYMAGWRNSLAKTEEKP